ncbi:hypothetical protein HDZ31DRAFT_45464 [Schizophyllum fasciatum]
MKIAVVGSGVAGLGATWLLNEHSAHQVHLYEADSRPGGHAHTVRFHREGQEPEQGVDVDTFRPSQIVFNPTTYPNFLRFLRMNPEITILPTEMTFSVSRDHGAFEWAGKDLRAVFCQPQRLLDPDMWRLLYDVLRFNACARRILDDDAIPDDMPIGEYLVQEGYSDAFKDNYLIPMTAAIWSTPPEACATDFPARTLVRFMRNHHLLQITGKPKWLTIEGGSIKYVQRILARLPPSQLHLSTPVHSVRTLPDARLRTAARVELRTAAGTTAVYDRVILACHSGAALRILDAGGGITQRERDVLGTFRWTANECILHRDERLMPKSKRAWSCWNYLASTRTTSEAEAQAADPPSRTYGMNELQHIPYDRYGPVLVTLNSPRDRGPAAGAVVGPFEPAAGTVVGRWTYEHPVLDAKAVRAQKLLPLIQGTRAIWYAGAYTRYGFHEDGFASGLAAAVAAGGAQPYGARPPSSDTVHPPSSDTVHPPSSDTVHPPFPLVADIDAHLRRVPGEWPLLAAAAARVFGEGPLVARAFDALEWAGVPRAVARLACPVLAGLRRALGVALEAGDAAGRAKRE